MLSLSLDIYGPESKVPLEPWNIDRLCIEVHTRGEPEMEKKNTP